DRMVELVREGIDCVLRVGAPEDSGMIRRPLALLSEVTCASPAYLTRYGMPDSPDGLAGHLMVGFLSSRTGDVMPLEFTEAGRLRHITLPSRVTSNDSATAAELALAGFGLYQAPRYRFAEELASGQLVEILPDHA
ncbi:LysR family transcriptional regulator, partial [Thioclava sp. BHET1]